VNIPDGALSPPGGQELESISPYIFLLHLGEEMITQNATIPGCEERNFAVGTLHRIGALVKTQFSPTLGTASGDPGWLIQRCLLDRCLKWLKRLIRERLRESFFIDYRGTASSLPRFLIPNRVEIPKHLAYTRT
jgi:hypothetical protein